MIALDRRNEKSDAVVLWLAAFNVHIDNYLLKIMYHFKTFLPMSAILPLSRCIYFLYAKENSFVLY